MEHLSCPLTPPKTSQMPTKLVSGLFMLLFLLLLPNWLSDRLPELAIGKLARSAHAKQLRQICSHSLEEKIGQIGKKGKVRNVEKVRVKIEKDRFCQDAALRSRSQLPPPTGWRTGRAASNCGREEGEAIEAKEAGATTDNIKGGTGTRTTTSPTSKRRASPTMPPPSARMLEAKSRTTSLAKGETRRPSMTSRPSMTTPPKITRARPSQTRHECQANSLTNKKESKRASQRGYFGLTLLPTIKKSEGTGLIVLNKIKSHRLCCSSNELSSMSESSVGIL